MVQSQGLTFDLVQLLGQFLFQLRENKTLITRWSHDYVQQPITDRVQNLLHSGPVLPGGERRRVTFLLQVHLQELLNGQLTGGRVLKLC